MREEDSSPNRGICNRIHRLSASGCLTVPIQCQLLGENSEHGVLDLLSGLSREVVISEQVANKTMLLLVRREC